MSNIDEIFSIVSKGRENIKYLLKQKRYFSQAEYEELRQEAERIKQKYVVLNSEVNKDIESINKSLTDSQDILYNGGFISIQEFASSVESILSNTTNKVWEIVAIAFSYKKRIKQSSGLVLVPTDANIIAVARKGAFNQQLTDMIFKDKNWLGNNQAMFGFIDMVERGEIVLLHIVEQENRTEKMLNIFESGFNGDFDKYLLRFDLEYNEKNPVNKYPALREYMDKYVYAQLSKSKK